jgi:hypothetical protein
MIYFAPEHEIGATFYARIAAEVTGLTHYVFKTGFGGSNVVASELEERGLVADYAMVSPGFDSFVVYNDFKVQRQVSFEHISKMQDRHDAMWGAQL